MIALFTLLVMAVALGLASGCVEQPSAEPKEPGTVEAQAPLAVPQVEVGSPAQEESPKKKEVEKIAQASTAPVKAGKECKQGDTRQAADGCNRCSCRGGKWACTKMGCVSDRPTRDAE